MKRLLSITGWLLSLLALGALVVALALTFGGLPREAKPASQAFQSPIETPNATPLSTTRNAHPTTAWDPHGRANSSGAQS